MASIDADDLPSLEEAFTRLGYTRLLNDLKHAGFKSIAPLMALSSEDFLKIPNIGNTTVSLIEKVLMHHNLEHRQLEESLCTYLERQFGRVEDAPIGVLQIVVGRSGTTDWQIFAPLQLIGILEEADSPQMRVRDLMMMEPHELPRALEALGRTVQDPQKDTFNVGVRLRGLDGRDFAVLRAHDLLALQQQ